MNSSKQSKASPSHETIKLGNSLFWPGHGKRLESGLGPEESGGLLPGSLIGLNNSEPQTSLARACFSRGRFSPIQDSTVWPGPAPRKVTWAGIFSPAVNT